VLEHLNFVLELIMNKSICLLQGLPQVLIDGHFSVDLHFYEFLHQLRRLFQSLRLCVVTVSKVICLQIHAGTTSHNVHDNLDQSLLLKSVTHMLVTLQVLECEFELCFLVFLLADDDLLDHVESVDGWENVSQIYVRHWLQLVNVV